MLKPIATQQPQVSPAAFQNALLDWFSRHGKIYPWRQTEDPYAILVSEIMLQQTQIATVLQRGFYARWLSRFPNLETLAEATEEDLLKTWEGLGYYSRARNLQKTAQALLTQYAGIFPSSPEELQRLPGIGPYTAGAIASFAFNVSAPIVDGNVARVLMRLYDDDRPIDRPDTQKILWQRARDLVSPNQARFYNSALMELGQTHCSPKKPDCLHCPVAAFCLTKRPEFLPQKQKKSASIKVNEHAVFCHQDGKILLALESGSRRNGFWQLPLLPDSILSPFPLAHQLTYGITKYRVHLHIHTVQKDQLPSTLQNSAWHPIAQVSQLPISAPFRKALAHLLGG